MTPSYHDDKAFDKLRALVASGTAIALVGAGVSARIGYPPWGALLDALHLRAGGDATDLDGQVDVVQSVLGSLPPAPVWPADRMRPTKSIARHKDYLWRAEEYRSALHKDFDAVMASVFGAEFPPDECLKDIVRLPFRHILTTNYDFALERAHLALREEAPENQTFRAEPRIVDWSQRAETIAFLHDFFEARQGRRYVHLHGRCDRPASLVLADSDYTNRYIKSDRAVKQLFALFALQRVVFIGFSLEDADLVAILRQVNVAAGDDGDPRHFAIVGLRPGEDRDVLRRRLGRKFGVQPVFYEQPERAPGVDPYAGLAMLLDRLVATMPGEREQAKAAPPPAFERTNAYVVEMPMPATPRRNGTKARRRGIDVPEPRPQQDPEDPQKGQFGCLDTRDGRTISATVRTLERDWFEVTITVQATPGRAPIEDGAKVSFHLHDTFPSPVRHRTIRNGKAVLVLECYGAFTVGARLRESERVIELELDLAELEKAPMRFRNS